MKKLLFLITFVALLAAGCQHIPFVESDEDYAYSQEYDWSKPGLLTFKHQIKVCFSKWLAAEDRRSVLDSVDSYADGMIKYYPYCKNFPFKNYTVFIHENLEKCVAGYGLRIWCYGWIAGTRVVACWAPKKNMLDAIVGPRENDPLPVIIHEFWHAVFDAQHGYADGAHNKYFPGVQEITQKIRMEAKWVKVSQASIDGAMAYEYTPWCEAKQYSAIEDMHRMVRIVAEGIKQED